MQNIEAKITDDVFRDLVMDTGTKIEETVSMVMIKKIPQMMKSMEIELTKQVKLKYMKDIRTAVEMKVTKTIYDQINNNSKVNVIMIVYWKKWFVSWKIEYIMVS